VPPQQFSAVSPAAISGLCPALSSDVKFLRRFPDSVPEPATPFSDSVSDANFQKHECAVFQTQCAAAVFRGQSHRAVSGLIIDLSLNFRLNMESDLQSLFGIHAQLHSLAETPQPLPLPRIRAHIALDTAGDDKALDPVPTGYYKALNFVPARNYRALKPASDGDDRALDPVPTGYDRALEPIPDGYDRALDPVPAGNYRAQDPCSY
jgi:hypothetical protein